MNPRLQDQSQMIVTENKGPLDQYAGTIVAFPSADIDVPFSSQTTITGSFTHSGIYFDGIQAPGQRLSDIIGEILTDLQFLRRDSSTSKRPVPELLERTVTEIFSSSREEEFAYGYTSKLASSLEDFIQRYGVDAIQAIQYQIPQKHVSVDVVIETLHSIGRSRHQASHDQRLLLLLSTLSTPLARIRSAAALGLAYMDDPKAIPILKNALNQETHNSAKVWLQRALEQLEDTQSHT